MLFAAIYILMNLIGVIATGGKYVPDGTQILIAIGIYEICSSLDDIKRNLKNKL